MTKSSCIWQKLKDVASAQRRLRKTNPSSYLASPPPKSSSELMEETRNWVDMPDDLMANILQRLPALELLKSARRVCRSWRRICKDPAMWKVICVEKSLNLDEWNAEWNTEDVLGRLTKQAVDLSCGELIDISIKHFGTNDILDYIVLRSSKLRCLDIMNCILITGSGLIRAVKRLPQLEELHLSVSRWIRAQDLEVIGRNCPQLKSFIMMYSGNFIDCDDRALAIAHNMPGLCHLKVDDKQMTTDGLKAILNGCPHLQSLDVHGCSNLYLEGNYKLGKLCMERITDFKYGWGSINRGRLFRR